MKRYATLLLLGTMIACRMQDNGRPGTGISDGIQVGRYQTDTLADAGEPGRAVTLELKKDSTAVLTSAGEGQSTRQVGRFSADGKNLRVRFPGGSDSSSMTFRWRLVSSRLVPVDWDRAVYGPAGLTLHLR